MTELTDLGAEAERYMRFKEIDTGYRAVRWHEKTLYEQSRPGTVNDILPVIEAALAAETGPVLDKLPSEARRTVPPAMPELTEPEILRHYIRCSQMTFGYDSGSNVGVGTCSMKYSPRLNEQLANSSNLTGLHPLQPEESLQGVLEIMYSMRTWLCELGGMDEVTFQPRGGGHGSYTNACMIRAYHHSRGEDFRDEIITCRGVASMQPRGRGGGRVQGDQPVPGPSDWGHGSRRLQGGDLAADSGCDDHCPL